MRLTSYSRIWVASCFLILAATRIWAFAPTSTLPTVVTLRRGTTLSPLDNGPLEAQDCECDNPEDTNAMPASLVHQKGSGELFRSAKVTDVDGNMVRLGDKMGKGKSVVIFLRHLG